MRCLIVLSRGSVFPVRYMCDNVIKRDYGPDKYSEIPPHGRWQHFEVGGQPRVDDLLKIWKQEGHDDKELTRRLIDLFFVSVLLDAGVYFTSYLWPSKDIIN